MKIYAEFNYSLQELHKTIKIESDFGFVREIDSVRLKEVSGHRAYITGINKGIPYTTLAKKITYADGEITVKFGKQVINIGKYEQVA